jgi:Saxitoxin biosynthesis operon protein SxtJ
MRLVFKEDPKAWRKQALLTLLGLGVITALLTWRHRLTPPVCGAVLAALALAAIGALIRPRWFRGYYRLSMRLGFYFSQCLGYIVLAMLFVLVVTPLGFVMRLAGKDPLQIRRPRDASTYWSPGKEFGPLDRMF